MTTFATLLATTIATMAAAAQPNYDIVVYGGTPSGIMAAIQGARMGKAVVLIEPGRHLGGLTSGGLVRYRHWK